MHRFTLTMTAMAMAGGLLPACATPPVAAEVARVEGVVVIAPARPGPQHPGDAADQPCANAPVRLLTVQGRLAAQRSTDARGHFALDVAPGSYRLKVGAPDVPYPRCEPMEVEARHGSTTHVIVRCDSGMR